MKCPDCRTPVDFSRKACPSCKVLYQEAFEARAWAAFRRGKKARPAVRLTRSQSAALAVAALAAAGVFAYLLWPAPEGLPLPPKPLSSLRGFALAVPAGWTADLAEQERGGRVSAARLTDGTTSVEILASSEREFVRARSAAGAAELAAAEFNGSDSGLESISELEIDRLPAVRLTVAGGRTYLPSPNAGKRVSELGRPAPRYESLEFGAELILVPGRGGSYLIKISSSRDELRRQRRLLDGLIGSLRITRRPRLAEL